MVKKSAKFMPLINFYGLGIEVECEEGKTIFDVARENSIPIAESCNGDRTCGHCRVLVLNGMENLSSPDFEEINYPKQAFIISWINYKPKIGEQIFNLFSLVESNATNDCIRKSLATEFVFK